MEFPDEDAKLQLTETRRQEILASLRREREQRKQLIARGEELRLSNTDLTVSGKNSIETDSGTDALSQLKAALHAQVQEERLLKTPNPTKRSVSPRRSYQYPLKSPAVAKKPPPGAKKPQIAAPKETRASPIIRSLSLKSEQSRSSPATPPRYSQRSRESDVAVVKETVERDWTFRPEVHQYKKGLKSEDMESRLDRLSRPKSATLKEREKQRLQQEVAALKDCTFRPKISDYDSRRVEENEPIGDRLHSEAERRVKERENLAARHEEVELANYTFHPRTHSANRQNVPIHKRLDEVTQRRQEQLQKLKEEIEKAESDLTFHPRVTEASKKMYQTRMEQLNLAKAPIADKLSIEAAKVEEKKQKLAADFEAAERDKCTFHPHLQPSKPALSTSFSERQLQFLEKKRIDSAPPVTEPECTFHPKVLKTSDMIVKSREESMDKRLERLCTPDKKRWADARERAKKDFEEKYTFEPKIDDVSRRLGRSATLAELAYNTEKKASLHLQAAAAESTYSFRPSLYSPARSNVQSHYSQSSDISLNISQHSVEKQQKIEEYRKLRESQELRECTFTPKTTLSASGKGDESPVIVRGLDQFFQHRDRARKLSAEKRDREVKVFREDVGTRPPRALVTTPKPFDIRPSSRTERVEKIAAEVREREKRECSFTPNTKSS